MSTGSRKYASLTPSDILMAAFETPATRGEQRFGGNEPLKSSAIPPTSYSPQANNPHSPYRSDPNRGVGGIQGLEDDFSRLRYSSIQQRQMDLNQTSLSAPLPEDNLFAPHQSYGSQRNAPAYSSIKSYDAPYTGLRVNPSTDSGAQGAEPSIASTPSQAPPQESAFHLVSRVEDIISSFDTRMKTEELLSQAPITQNGGYTREFVLSLEEHYREQLVAQLSTIQEATNRRLMLKEDELAQLHESVREMHKLFAQKERVLLEEVERLHKEKRDGDEVQKSQIEALKQRQAEEIEKIEKKHIQDLDKATLESETAIKRVCEWARSQLVGLDTKLESQRITFQQQLDAVENGKAMEVSRIHDEKVQSIGEIRQILALTEMKLAEAKKEIEVITAARHEDLTNLRGQLEECLRVIQQKDVDHNKAIQILQKELSHRETEMKKLVQQERLKKEVDKQEVQYQADLLRDKVTKLQAYIKDSEQRYMVEIRHLTEENQKLLAAYNSTQTQIQSDSQQYIKLTNMTREYEREISILKNELHLTQNEERRLREENAEFRLEIGRLDKAIHGKIPTSPTKSGFK